MTVYINGTTGYSGPVGTIGDLTTTGNTTLGDATTDTLNVGAGGLVKDASGNVGIGTTSPYQKLSVVAGSGSSAYVEVQSTGFTSTLFGQNNAGDAYVYNDYAGNIRLWTGGSEPARITSGGVLLVGDTTSDLTGTVKASVIGNFAVQNGGTTGTYLQVAPGVANGVVDIKADARSGAYPPLTFSTSATERMRIDASGNVGIGNASPSSFGRFVVSGTGTDIILTRLIDDGGVANDATFNIALDAGTVVGTDDVATSTSLAVGSVAEGVLWDETDTVDEEGFPLPTFEAYTSGVLINCARGEGTVSDGGALTVPMKQEGMLLLSNSTGVNQGFDTSILIEATSVPYEITLQITNKIA